MLRDRLFESVIVLSSRGGSALRAFPAKASAMQMKMRAHHISRSLYGLVSVLASSLTSCNVRTLFSLK